MTTLTIEDLPLSEELDSAAMAAVRGGDALGLPVIGPILGFFEVYDKSSGGTSAGGKTTTPPGHVNVSDISLTKHMDASSTGLF